MGPRWFVLIPIFPAVVALAGEDQAVERARVDLSGRLGVLLQEVSVLERDERTWPDGAIGCPQPGMAYKQVITPGSALVLQAGGRRYHYHAAGSSDYFFCAKPEKLPEPVDNPDL